MAVDFSKLQPCTFDGLAIPVISCHVDAGDAGVAWHEYPYRDGADGEPTGARPRSGTIVAAFIDGLNDAGQSVTWPDSLTALRDRCRVQEPGLLVHPTLGTIPAAYLRVVDEYEPGVRDGTLRVQIEWKEDSSDDLTLSDQPTSPLGQLADAASLSDADLSALSIPTSVDLPDAGGGIGATMSSLTAAASELTSSINNFQADAGRPFRQAAALIRATDTLLSTASQLKDPANWQARRDLRDMKLAASDSVASVAPSRKLATFVVAALTTGAAVAAATKNKLGDVMSLNPGVPDFNAIAAGTSLTVYMSK
jgi:prophage DNA circulation protein